MVSKCLDDLHDSYLVMNEEKHTIIGYQYQMMRKFNMPNLLLIATYQDAESHLIYYDISHKNTLVYCMKEKTFMYPLLRKLVMSLLAMLESLHQYLLDEKQLVLDPEFIFYDRLECEFYFLFLPCESTRKSIKDQVYELFDLLIKDININDYKAVSLIHRLRIAVENDCFNIKEIEAIVQQIELLEIKSEDEPFVSKNKTKSNWFSGLFTKKEL